MTCTCERNSRSTSSKLIIQSFSAWINPSFPRNTNRPFSLQTRDGMVFGSEMGIPSERFKWRPIQIPASSPFFTALSADEPFTYLLQKESNCKQEDSFQLQFPLWSNV